ncbi:uncharacterized protein LOC132265851 [Phlebotomus argentipes]|uniref:uncharacterized protein LOC132265851 n=1 Tax=Phlebotomus argentipes TaxID=94469 RepID=UPI0028933D11|nr:uncharacterized protein LOC132265851 [Phlebotomus argentipes]XP_059622619.1 uncharacterized protein LOC132265851 [Phlebotomus argentipes]
MLKNVKNLCRVCSGPGDYDICAPIPFYLHEMGLREAVSWPHPIRVLLQDVLNIPVLPNDGLPQKMCSVCISYMKHAVIFRNQALTCRLGIIRASQAGDWLCGHHTNPLIAQTVPRAAVTVEDRNDKRKPANATINKLLPKTKPLSVSRGSKDIPRMTDNMQKSEGYFGYRQKAFVEDDITQMSMFDGQNFAANAPEKLSERKCLFCRMRFMFEETYEEHTDQCLLKRFTEFINQCNQVLQLKVEDKITHHEFVRRMVFMLQSNQDILDKLSDGPEPPNDGSEEESSLADDFSGLKICTKRLEQAVKQLTMSTEQSVGESELKKVICPTCGKGLPTISHLDSHRFTCR